MELALATAQRNDFKTFVNKFFSASFIHDPQPFVGGQYVDDCCDRLDNFSKTINVSARDHFKSTRLYALVMYLIATAPSDIEIQYFSYSIKMAEYHIRKIGSMIRRNPYFEGWEKLGLITNNQVLGQSLLNYSNINGRITITPQGLSSFNRGVHADYILIDDPLKDPDDKLAPTIITKINTAIKAEIIPMVKPTGKIHIVGTPQTNVDFFFDEGLARTFEVNIQPAIVDFGRKIVIWPEWFSFEKLMERRAEIGQHLFKQEYLAQPVYSADKFLNEDAVRLAVDPELKTPTKYDGEMFVVAGFDIGMKRHPSHLVVFRKSKTGQYIQLLSHWMDGWTYLRQVSFIKRMIRKFNIDKVFYDSTRGELEALHEQEKLPREMVPVNFTHKNRVKMATKLDAVFTRGQVRLLNEQRQLNQMLVVTGSLDAIESKEGHGEAFWSNALALGYEKPHGFSYVL